MASSVGQNFLFDSVCFIGIKLTPFRFRPSWLWCLNVLHFNFFRLTGNTLRLNSDFVLSRLGATAMESVNEYRLLSWLGMQEDIHRMVMYQVSEFVWISLPCMNLLFKICTFHALSVFSCLFVCGCVSVAVFVSPPFQPTADLLSTWPLQCDSRMTPWTLRCIRQADCLLVVGLASHDPRKLGAVERQLGENVVWSRGSLRLPLSLAGRHEM